MNTVLVVDDSVIDRRRVAGLLERSEPYAILYADDGTTALEQLQGHQVDVVLTDLTMPGMDGLALVKAMQAKYPHVPVVLMTSMGSEETAVQALRQGAASYVPKRRLATDLVRTVSSIIASGRADRVNSELLGHRTRIVSSFSVPPLLDLVTAVPAFVQRTLAEVWRCDPRELTNLGIAVEEALLNALYYGTLEISPKTRHAGDAELQAAVDQRVQAPPYRDRRIFVEVRVTPMQVTIVIRDEGPGFDTSTIPDPDDPTLLETTEGRGLRLMQTFMDQVTYNAAGNEVTLTSRRPRKRANAS